MKIFWSWQYDTPGKTGRHFIRDVLQNVVAELKADIELEEATREAIHLDHDQESLTGSFDLAREILAKIEASEFFVADVTSIGIVDPAVKKKKDGEEYKRLINSNVALELGFAYKAVDNRRLFLVMNDHYGSHEDMPFDLRGKGGTVTFTLRPDALKDEIERVAKDLQKRLVKLFKAAVASMAQNPAPVPVAQPNPFTGRAAYNAGPGLYFKQNDILATAGEPGEQEFRFKGKGIIFLRLAPTYEVAPIGLAKVVRAFDAGRTMPMSERINGLNQRNKYGAISFDFQGKETITALTQGFSTGELWGINELVLRPHQVSGVEHTIIPIITFEKIFLKTLTNYVAVFSKVYDFKPPYTAIMGVAGMTNTYLTAPGGPLGTGQQIGPIYEPYFESIEKLEGAEEADVNGVLRKFFSAFYDLSATARDEILTDQVIAAHGLPPR